MNRILLTLPALTALLTTSASAEQISLGIQTETSTPTSNTVPNSPTAASHDLRTWSISNAQDVIEKSEGEFVTEETFRIFDRFRSYIPLSRSGGGVVAIVQLAVSDEASILHSHWSAYEQSILLNPRWTAFDYGPIPELQNMTLADADQLWGSDPAHSSASSNRSYALVSAKGEKYFLDVEFSEGRLQKYRVRGPGICCTDWKIPGQEIKITVPFLLNGSWLPP